MASPHGARICTSNAFAFLVWGVEAPLGLRSFSLMPALPLPAAPAQLPHPLLWSRKLFNLLLKFPPEYCNLESWPPKLLYHPTLHLGGHRQKRTNPDAIFSNG